MLKPSHKNRLVIALSCLALVITYFIGYEVERNSSQLLILLFTTTFLAYLSILYLQLDDLTVNKLVILAIAIRVLLLFAFPLLSDDIYRFVWDGRLLNLGIHPFKELPTYYMNAGNSVLGLDLHLFNKLNSPDYFTIYPPFAQFIFSISSWFSNSVLDQAIIIRTLIILAETGTIYLMIKLLERYGLPKRNVLIYALNPLVIIELTGNLHFEAFMIFFLLLSIYSLHHNSIIKASLFMATAIASKLIPLMLLPLFLRRLKINVLIKFYAFSGAFLVLLFIPLFNYDLIEGMSSSLSLYFQKFEFNASVYYLVREVGYWIKGYNIIETAGKFLAGISFIGIMILSIYKFEKPNLMEMMMWVLIFYFLLATTVHPWYIVSILALSVFTQFKFAILWSFMIFLSYLGYTETDFQENMLIVIVEYTSVLFLAGFELYNYATNKPTWFSKIF